jgi:hypothetical protein
VNQATSSIVATSTTTIIKATNVIVTTKDPTFVIKKINATIILIAMIRSLRTASPTKRRIIASAITSRKRVIRPCTMTSPLHQARTPCPEKGVALAQDLLCTLIFGLALAQAAGAMTTIMWLMMIASQPKRGHLYSSNSDDGGHIHHPNKSDTVFATFSAPAVKRGTRTHKWGITPAENSCVPPCILFQIGN